MERLDVTFPPNYPGQEAAIHIARYANVLPFIKDKVVLDIACGEGYGAALMMRAGARRVVGVDISGDAIKRSKNSFSNSNAEYVEADATQLEMLFEVDTFDVVVSLETIEHVSDDRAYLMALKAVAKPQAIFLISCPNDYWYYPLPSQSNPHHLRKYKLEEFQAVSTEILGDHVHWGAGTAVFGFGTAPLHPEEYEALCDSDSWMKASYVPAAFVVPNESLDPLTVDNASYFVGMWNVDKFSHGAAYFALAMDGYARMSEALSFDSASQLKLQLETERSQSKAALDEERAAGDFLLKNERAEKEIARSSLQKLQRELRNKSLLLAAVQSENRILRENIGGMQAEISNLKSLNSMMQTGYWRYRRITDKIPASLRRVLVKCFRWFKR